MEALDESSSVQSGGSLFEDVITHGLNPAYKCSLTKRLMATPVLSNQGLYYNSLATTHIDESHRPFTESPGFKEEIQEYCRLVLSSALESLSPDIPRNAIKIVGECLTALEIEPNLELVRPVIAALTKGQLKELIQIYERSISFEDMLKLARVSEDFQKCACRIIRRKLKLRIRDAHHKTFIAHLATGNFGSEVLDIAIEFSRFKTSTEQASVNKHLSLLEGSEGINGKLAELKLIEAWNLLKEEHLRIWNEILILSADLKYSHNLNPDILGKIRLGRITNKDWLKDITSITLFDCLLPSEFSQLKEEVLASFHYALATFSKTGVPMTTITSQLAACLVTIQSLKAKAIRLIEFHNRPPTEDDYNKFVIESLKRAWLISPTLIQKVFKLKSSNFSFLEVSQGILCCSLVNNQYTQYRAIAIDLTRDFSVRHIVDFPYTLAATHLAYYDGYLYLVGSNVTNRREVLFNRYCIAVGRWEALPPPPPTEEVAINTLSALQWKLFWLESYPKGSTLKIQVLDLSTFIWSTSFINCPLLKSRNHVYWKADSIEDRLYFIQEGVVYTLIQREASYEAISIGEICVLSIQNIHISNSRLYIMNHRRKFFVWRLGLPRISPMHQ